MSGETRGVGFQPLKSMADLKQPFAAAFDGYINIPADAIYEFQVDSKWDSSLAIDGEPLDAKAGGTLSPDRGAEILGQLDEIEQRLLGFGALVGIFDRHRQRAGIDQRVGQ